MRTLFKVLGVLAVVAVVGIVLVVIAAVYIGKTVHVHESGGPDKKTVSIATPMGEISVHENRLLNPESVGIPIYPGAVRSEKSGGVDFQIDSGSLHKDWSVSGATYYTNDSVEQVESFYKDKFPRWNSKWEKGDHLHIETKDEGHIRSVEIQREDDRTRIGVASVGPPASN